MQTPQIADDRWRDGDWFRVHNVIVTDYAEEVTSTYALAVYVVLACHADRGGTSWASHKTMAREARCSEPQVRRSLAMLEAAGLLAIEPRFVEGRQTSNRYRLLPVKPKGGALPEQADDLAETGAPAPQSSRGEPAEQPWNQTHGTRPKEPETIRQHSKRYFDAILARNAAAQEAALDAEDGQNDASAAPK